MIGAAPAEQAPTPARLWWAPRLPCVFEKRPNFRVQGEPSFAKASDGFAMKSSKSGKFYLTFPFSPFLASPLG